MVLYGSVLRGDAEPESDVDLLIVATGDVRAVWQALGDIAFEVMLEHRERVSPIIYYRHPCAFLGEVREKGEEAGVGRAFRQALDWRNRTRYDPHGTLTEADADDAIDVAEQLTNLLQGEVDAS